MKFKKGKSGNPNGRPKGIKDRRVLFADLIEDHKEELLQTAINLALEGDEQMLKLLLERLLPAKPRDNLLPEIGELKGDVVEQCDKMISLVTEGIITPIEANYLLHALHIKTELTDFKEIKTRIDALTKTLK